MQCPNCLFLPCDDQWRYFVGLSPHIHNLITSTNTDYYYHKSVGKAIIDFVFLKSRSGSLHSLGHVSLKMIFWNIFAFYISCSLLTGIMLSGHSPLVLTRLLSYVVQVHLRPGTARLGQASTGLYHRHQEHHTPHNL